MPEDFENAIEFLDGQKTATVTLHDRRLRNRVMKLAEQYPDKVQVIKRPNNKGQQGYLVAHVPASWIQVVPVVKRQYTEEEKEVLRERLKAAREKSPVGKKKSPG